MQVRHDWEEVERTGAVGRSRRSRDGRHCSTEVLLLEHCGVQWSLVLMLSVMAGSASAF